MKISQLRSLDENELQRDLERWKAEVVRLSFEIASKQLKNNRECRKARKNVARILTLLKERQNKTKAEEKKQS